MLGFTAKYMFTPDAPQTITFDKFDYHGLSVSGMVITIWRTLATNKELEADYSFLASEKAIADALEVSHNRLHKAVVRSGKLGTNWTSKPTLLKSLEDAWFEMYYDRLMYQNEVYNPLHLYDDAIADLALRRPYVNKARELYTKIGYPKQQFGRQGMVK